ncbi:MAG: hypothetical protein ACRDV4_05300, partial [Acidimicrobiales bacterium]
MDAIDFRGALLRGWRLLLLCALIGAVVGYLWPRQTAPPAKPVYVGQAVAVPSKGAKSGLNYKELLSDAQSDSVIAAAARDSGLSTPGGTFSAAEQTTEGKKHNKKKSKSHLVVLNAVGGTAKQAADRANTYAYVLGLSIYDGVKGRYNTSLCKAELDVDNIQTTLGQVDDDIGEEEANGDVDGTALPVPPAPDYSQCDDTVSNSGSSSSDDAFTSGGIGDAIVLDASASPASPATPPTVPGTTTSDPPTASTTTVPPTSTTVPSTAQIKKDAGNDVVLAALIAEQTTLKEELLHAVQQQTSLSLGGPPGSPYSIQSNATPASAVPLVAKHITVSSFFSHKSSKALAGGLLGLVIAAAIIILVEMSDKSIRSVTRAEEAFGFPVVAEIPMRPATASRRQLGAAPGPRLDVVLAPASPVAEAYRALRTALLLEPLAADLAAYLKDEAIEAAVVGGQASHTLLPARGVGRHSPAQAGNGDLAPYGPRGQESTRAPGSVSLNGYGPRQVVLVVSPGREPSRPGVVANLAAVCAEAGAQVLVVSMRENSLRHTPNGSSLEPNGEPISPEDLVPRTSQSVVEGVRGLALE